MCVCLSRIKAVKAEFLESFQNSIKSEEVRRILVVEVFKRKIKEKKYIFYFKILSVKLKCCTK